MLEKSENFIFLIDTAEELLGFGEGEGFVFDSYFQYGQEDYRDLKPIKAVLEAGEKVVEAVEKDGYD